MSASTLLRGKTPPIREKRLDSLSAYLGEVGALLKQYQQDDIDQRIRTYSQSSTDDLQSALRLLAGIRDAVTIIHGPRGCAIASLEYALSHGASIHQRHWITTNLTQRETIMGSDQKLSAAIKHYYSRYQPKVIFVVATPTISINNDDILATSIELADELGIEIIPIFTSGFASQIAVQGQDTALHGIFKAILTQENGRESRHVNLLATDEQDDDLREARRLLDALQIDYQLLPQGADVATLRRASSAAASIALNDDKSGYLGQILHEVAHVPYLRAPRPVGLLATKQWLDAVATQTGRKEEAQQLHARESAQLAALLHAKPFNHVRVHLSLDPSTALGAIELVHALGGEVTGLTVQHIDRTHLEGLRQYLSRWPTLQIHVGDGQGFEEVNLLLRTKPDLYIGSGLQIAQIAQTGVAALYAPRIALLGYHGVESLARRGQLALRHRGYQQAIQDEQQLYRPGWLQRSANWHIKQEVK